MITWLLFFRFELKLAFARGQMFIAILFYLSVVLAFPLAIGPNHSLITDLAPAILWVGVLFSSLFGQERLFTIDQEDGTLDLFRLARLPLTTIIFVKAFTLWSSTIVPLLLAVPFFSLILDLPPQTLPELLLSLLVGTPALALLGTLMAALTTSMKHGTLLAPILSLPFSVPVLIFGTISAQNGDKALSALLILGGFTLLLLLLTPLAGAKALSLAND